MPISPDPIAEFYNQNCEDEWQRLERAAQCLVKCDPERLTRLLRGQEPCGVL